MSGLSKDFLYERDTQIYQLRATGMSPTDIATRMDVSVATVHNAISRHVKKVSGQGLNIVEVVVMELDRIDKMQAAVFPMTQHRRVRMDNGDEVTVEPDLRAIDTVLNLMRQRAKLLGLDINRTMDITPEQTGVDVKSSIKGELKDGTDTEVVSKEDESKKMLELAVEAGIIDQAVVDAIESGDAVEAEVVEDE